MNGYRNNYDFNRFMQQRMYEAEQEALAEYDRRLSNYQQPPPPNQSAPQTPTLEQASQYETRPYIYVESEQEVDDFVIPVTMAGREFVMPMKDGSAVFGKFRDPHTLEPKKVKFVFQADESDAQKSATLDEINAQMFEMNTRMQKLEHFIEMASALVGGGAIDKPKTGKPAKREPEAKEAKPEIIENIEPTEE